MKIAIVGSRHCEAKEQVFHFVAGLAQRDASTVILSGGAPGVDTWAEQAAKEYGLQTEIYKADWDTHGKSAGFIRNTTIVAEADKVVAFWDGKSRGTLDTINKAKKAGLSVYIIPV